MSFTLMENMTLIVHMFESVSLTHCNPYQHIWTFMVATQEHVCNDDCRHECPCAPNSLLNIPSFIGNEYFCESGILNIMGTDIKELLYSSWSTMV